MLEKFTDHPELQGQLLRDTLEENFDLTLYVEPDGMVQAASPAPRGAQALAGRLKLARSYLSVGLKDKATAILREIIRKHPKSKQAAIARQLLRQD